MPRAKRTNRAEARRRYRASLDEPLDEEAEESLEASPKASPERSAASKGQASRGDERPSLAYAFREAFHPVTLREDLAYLPRLLLDRSVWLPCLITLAVGIAYAATGSSNWLIGIAATYFVAPPALGSVFLGGFLAPRASYLVGLIIGLFSAIVASVVILTAPTSLVTGEPIVTTTTPSATAGAAVSPAASPVASGAAASAAAATAEPTPSAGPTPTPAPTPAPAQDQIIYAFVTSPPFGMFFASAAAWYRRFLRLSNPARARQQQQQRKSDGRTRSNPNQKPRR